MNTLIEIAGFAALVAGVWVLTSVGWALLLAGGLAWFVAQGLGDVKIPVARLRWARNAVVTWRAKRKREAS